MKSEKVKMKEKIFNLKVVNLANAITLLRIPLFLFLIQRLEVLRLNPLLLSVFVCALFAIDGLDGWVARIFHKETLFGGFLDLATDRIIEVGFWLYLLLNTEISFIFPALIIVRVFMVDIMALSAYNKGDYRKEKLKKNNLHNNITYSKSSRAFYGTLKAISFSFMLIYYQNLYLLNIFAIILVTISLIRGFSKIVEFRKFIFEPAPIRDL
ncbi:hypothetical protein COY62_03810 [bacterium (Candidatus Howlettbacteria) CG_4_10_14_0_8_um_filter_40_9]|nr:MAG: hypothetical protein COY62_03810 [bacterium (Candidatus Howlettbacteria) CG_4_10_14_0_8_um_filter_40_9]